MAQSHNLQAVFKAFSGLGVEEKTLISELGNSKPEHRQLFRKESSHLFNEDQRSFERWNAARIQLLKREFLRFQSAVVLWTMHPWERDARLVKKALIKGAEAYSIIVEVACTRSPEELLGARKAYHSLFDQSMEEDVASHVRGPERKLLVGLVSAYRYDGQKVNQDTAKAEAKFIANVIKHADKKNPLEDDDFVRILATRSIFHLRALFNYYHETSGTDIIKDVGAHLILRDTVQCLASPATYFSNVLEVALGNESDKNVQKGLTRVLVTRADHEEMKEINEAYLKLHGVALSKKIEEKANGNYRDFLLTLVAKGN